MTLYDMSLAPYAGETPDRIVFQIAHKNTYRDLLLFFEEEIRPPTPTPLPTPSGITTAAIGSDGLRVSWPRTPGLRYWMRFAASGATLGDWFFVRDDPVLLTGLTPDTTYRLQVQARSSSNDSPPSAIYTARTAAASGGDTPKAPNNLQVWYPWTNPTPTPPVSINYHFTWDLPAAGIPNCQI